MIISGRVLYSSLFDSNGKVSPNGLLKIGSAETLRTELVCNQLDELLQDRLQREIYRNPDRLAEFQIVKPYKRHPIFPLQRSFSPLVFLCSIPKKYSRARNSEQIIMPVVFDQRGVANTNLFEVDLKAILAVAVSAKPYVMKLAKGLSIIGVSLKIAGIVYQKELKDDLFDKSIRNSGAD